jgi:hypothetical protein
MTDKNKIIEKIRKCFALASSANEHEAAAAMRQAQKLIEMHRISDSELLAAGVTETAAHAGAAKKPVGWENFLAATIGYAFGCKVIFAAMWGAGKWKFVGMGANAEIAQYAFTVLFRQLRRSRAAFIKQKCKRLKPASKTRRADLFCDAWVNAVAAKAEAMASQEQDAAAIDAYLLQHYPDLSSLQARDRNAERNLRDKDWDAVSAGSEAGRRAQLNRGVGGADTQPLLGMAA